MAINKVFIKGNISSEVELKQTQSGTSVCSFNVAVNRFTKDPNEAKADFFTVVAWQQKAEFVSRFFKKGSGIVIVGRLENRDWTDKNGNKRISTEIIAEDIDFVGDKSQQTQPQTPLNPASFQSGNMPIAYSGVSNPRFEEIATDDDFPF